MRPTDQVTDHAADPFLCAEIIAARLSGQQTASRPSVDPGPWAQCTSCSDPGHDDQEHDWPEASPASVLLD